MERKDIRVEEVHIKKVFTHQVHFYLSSFTQNENILLQKKQTFSVLDRGLFF